MKRYAAQVLQTSADNTDKQLHEWTVSLAHKCSAAAALHDAKPYADSEQQYITSLLACFIT